LKQTAEVLQKTEDAKQYSNLHRNILKHFRKEFVTPNGRLVAPTQTAHVLALMFDLQDEKDSARAADTLADLIYQSDIHLTTGFVGTPYLCHVLTQYVTTTLPIN
jgi:alpha-L-rhamnosidase